MIDYTLKKELQCIRSFIMDQYFHISHLTLSALLYNVILFLGMPSSHFLP